ncbi:MAG: FAD-dependent oxidoreductase [Candidatus Omnitrophica bacterium]|nr:FAD-dependent oxidoreductase [Candidatus Omnitrophota bacterium]
MIYDLIIIGAGPAGITASVYAARKRINFLVISKDIGGQTAWSGDIENYTGYQFVTGADLVTKFEEHMKKYNVPLKEEGVLELKKKGDSISIKTNKGAYETKTAIVASGKYSKELGVPGEKEFKNKGVTYCATCDGPIFAGKDVAVIGGGNAGLDATLQLMKIAKHVHLINITPELTGDKIMQDKVEGAGNVTILNNTRVTEVMGDKMVTGIKIKVYLPAGRENEKEKTLTLQGIFVEIGLMPNSDFAKELDKNKKGEIKINSFNETNVPGIFAAGDVTDIPAKQIIIAAGEGSKALLNAFSFLSRKK